MQNLYRIILKLIFDFLVALVLFCILFIPALYFAFRIYLQDFSNPFYVPKRVLLVRFGANTLGRPDATAPSANASAIRAI